MNKRIIGFIFCLILFNVQMFANEIGLRVLGNDQDGYYVNIYWGKQLISDQSRSGELEAYFDNEDYAVREMLQGWKATQVKKENGKIILSNGDKVWGTNVYQLTVKVGYPWWLKTPALLVYAVICIITIYITKRIIVGRIRLSKQILIARVETAHEQKIYESKLNFFTNVAHEFFTPLTLIYTPVQYLLEKKDLSDDSRKYLNIIKDNAERMQRLIRELMDFRKAGARNLDICPEQIDIKELIDSVISNYVDILRENKITIHVENRCSLSLYSDRNSLEKILFNLLSNAFKYTPRLGVIQIYAVQKEDSSLNFTIRNSGKGLTDKQMAAIFDRYKIFDAPYLENSVSNGIGLNLTKQLVEILEGTIKVNSVLGKYVEFEVFIPPLG